MRSFNLETEIIWLITYLCAVSIIVAYVLATEKSARDRVMQWVRGFISLTASRRSVRHR